MYINSTNDNKLSQRGQTFAKIKIKCILLGCDAVLGQAVPDVQNKHNTLIFGVNLLLLLLQLALQPQWVLACSTVVEHSQQEGLTECCCQRHIKPPTWRRTRDLEHSNFRHKRPPASEATLANPAVEGETMGERWPRNFAESGDFHVTFGFFYMP
jgi:hypothetical protein